MADFITTWKENLERQGKTEEQIELDLQTQQALQIQLSEHLERDEANLVSLHRMGARFELKSESGSQFTHRKVLLLLALQFTISQLPALFGYPVTDASIPYYLLNVSFLVFPFMAIYLAKDWSKHLALYLGIAMLLCLLVNLQQANKAIIEETTFILSALHLPLFGILSLALFQSQKTYTQKLTRHLRFVGEVVLLTFLLICACFVAMMLSIILFEAIGIRIEDAVAQFAITAVIPLLPLLSVHLITIKGSRLGVLTRTLASLFLPVFTLLMMAFLAVMLFTGKGIEEDRSLLLAIDALLALLLLMILYATDLLETEQKSRFWQVMVIASSVTALLLDGVALTAIGSRLSAYGLSANRVAVLAENLLLFANLLSLALALLFKRSTAKIQALFLSIYALWFLFVTLLFPLFF